MLGLKIKAHASIDFDADRWELFFEDGRDTAAAALNVALQDAINAPGSTANSVEAAMQVVQKQYSHLGADDSEPQHLIDRVIRKAFGEDAR